MVERRKHKRYPMPRGTFVIFRNEFEPLHNYTKMSIGEIAMVLYKSEPETMGQVTNLSMGGISFGCNTINVPDTEKIQLDLLMAAQGIYLHNIPYALVPVSPPGKRKKKTYKYRLNALRFKPLNTEHKGQIRKMLDHHVG